jgi:nucleoid DNA-binding protein
VHCVSRDAVLGLSGVIQQRAGASRTGETIQIAASRAAKFSAAAALKQQLNS